ncbi:hypothetical protein BDR26DRAFT_862703 [Obelidium mucronatum]|nr:hypothetical protein BDR26DRAFT_862703 [Obelidium mucronatum]
MDSMANSLLLSIDGFGYISTWDNLPTLVPQTNDAFKIGDAFSRLRVIPAAPTSNFSTFVVSVDAESSIRYFAIPNIPSSSISASGSSLSSANWSLRWNSTSFNYPVLQQGLSYPMGFDSVKQWIYICVNANSAVGNEGRLLALSPSNGDLPWGGDNSGSIPCSRDSILLFDNGKVLATSTTNASISLYTFNPYTDPSKTYTTLHWTVKIPGPLGVYAPNAFTPVLWMKSGVNTTGLLLCGSTAIGFGSVASNAAIFGGGSGSPVPLIAPFPFDSTPKPIRTFTFSKPAVPMSYKYLPSAVAPPGGDIGGTSVSAMSIGMIVLGVALLACLVVIVVILRRRRIGRSADVAVSGDGGRPNSNGYETEAVAVSGLTSLSDEFLKLPKPKVSESVFDLGSVNVLREPTRNPSLSMYAIRRGSEKVSELPNDTSLDYRPATTTSVKSPRQTRGSFMSILFPERPDRRHSSTTFTETTIRPRRKSSIASNTSTMIRAPQQQQHHQTTLGDTTLHMTHNSSTGNNASSSSRADTIEESEAGTRQSMALVSMVSFSMSPSPSMQGHAVRSQSAGLEIREFSSAAAEPMSREFDLKSMVPSVHSALETDGGESCVSPTPSGGDLDLSGGGGAGGVNRSGSVLGRESHASSRNSVQSSGYAGSSSSNSMNGSSLRSSVLSTLSTDDYDGLMDDEKLHSLMTGRGGGGVGGPTPRASTGFWNLGNTQIHGGSGVGGGGISISMRGGGVINASSPEDTTVPLPTTELGDRQHTVRASSTSTSVAPLSSSSSKGGLDALPSGSTGKPPLNLAAPVFESTDDDSDGFLTAPESQRSRSSRSHQIRSVGMNSRTSARVGSAGLSDSDGYFTANSGLSSGGSVRSAATEGSAGYHTAREWDSS